MTLTDCAVLAVIGAFFGLALRYARRGSCDNCRGECTGCRKNKGRG